MGQTSSKQLNLWESQFEFDSKNSKVGIIKLSDRQTEDMYICRSIAIIDKKQIIEMDRLIDIKLSIQSPYITKLEKCETKSNRQYCAYGQNYYLLFKQPYQTLKQETLNRKFKNSKYTEQQLLLMLQVGVKAIAFLKNIRHPHKNISSSSFFVTENRSLLLGDPLMFPNQNSPIITRNGFVYPSPELIKFQNKDISEYNYYLSDLFTFGLVLLEVFFMSNMDCVYEKTFERVNQDIIQEKFKLFKSQELKKKLFILLDPEPKNRQVIFKYYLKSISTISLFVEKPKQKFKKNIQRYNLATSEVTEWRNEFPDHKRISSSQGQKTFSLSTTDHGTNFQEEKNFIKQEKQFSSNRIHFNDGQKFGMPIIQNSYTNPQYLFKNAQNHQFSQSKIRKLNTYPEKILNTSSNQTLVQNNHIRGFQRYQPRPHILENNYKSHQNVSQYGLNHLSNNNTSGYNYPIQSNIAYQNQLNSSYQMFKPDYLQNSVKFNMSQNNSQKVNFLPAYNPESTIRILNMMPISNSPYENKQLSAKNHQITSSTQEIENQMNLSRSMNKQRKNQNKVKIQLTIANKQQSSQNIQSLSKRTKSKYSANQEERSNIQNTNEKTYSPHSSLKKKGSSRKNSDRNYKKSNYLLSTINQRSEITDSLRQQSQQCFQQQNNMQNQLWQDNANNAIMVKNQRQYLSHQTISTNMMSSKSQQDDKKIWYMQYPSGTKYEGQMMNDKRNGFGTFYYIDGSKYHGEWIDNKMNGFGILYYPNGKIAYEGSWKMDNFHGKGKVYNDEPMMGSYAFNYEDCSNIDDYWLQYDGQLYDDKREGQGILRLGNGEYFEGKFVNDELHGLAKFHKIDGKIIDTMWSNNKLVKVLTAK